MRLLLEDGASTGLPGTLQFADVSVDESTGLVTLRASSPNPKQERFRGMYVRAIERRRGRSGHFVARSAPFCATPRATPPRMWSTPENKVEIRPLKVGPHAGQQLGCARRAQGR